jgi:aminopeptidase YwaD
MKLGFRRHHLTGGAALKDADGCVDASLMVRESLQLGNQASESADGACAFLWRCGAMSRDSFGADEHRTHRTSRRHDPTARPTRLQCQTHIRPACLVLDPGATLHAAKFLIRHQEEGALAKAGQIAPAETCAEREESGDHASLHIPDTGPADAVALSGKGPIGGGSRRPDRIGVSEDQQLAPAAKMAARRHLIPPSRKRPALDDKSKLGQTSGNQIDESIDACRVIGAAVDIHGALEQRQKLRQRGIDICGKAARIVRHVSPRLVGCRSLAVGREDASIGVRQAERSASMDVFDMVAGRIWGSRAIVDDFRTLCTFGGRFAGTESEARAREFLAARLAAALGAPVRRESVTYRGWDRGPACLRLAGGREFPACALVRSPATPLGGLRAPILDLGRGTPADFALAAEHMRGRIVLVRHEYMLAAGHVHRRRKYELAKMAGAAGFLIGCHLPGGLMVTGSSGAGAGDDIPAAGISYEAAAAVADRPEGEITLDVAGKFVDRVAENLFVDIPGESEERIVLSAHLDGHHFAESAIDNGSGIVSVLAAAAALKDIVGNQRRGLRVAFFNIEEWALLGSRDHLAALPEAERRALTFNVNLDSVAGAPGLAALTSGIPIAESLVNLVNRTHGFAIRVHRPFMGNSDHANFVRAGIPALRLCCGLDDPTSNLRFLLTAGDTGDKVDPNELKSAATAAAALVLAASEADIPRLSPKDIERTTAMT